jgi:hypothetical protein
MQTMTCPAVHRIAVPGRSSTPVAVTSRAITGIRPIGRSGISPRGISSLTNRPAPISNTCSTIVERVVESGPAVLTAGHRPSRR